MDCHKSVPALKKKERKGEGKRKEKKLVLMHTNLKTNLEWFAFRQVSPELQFSAIMEEKEGTCCCCW